jgi:hypothetical protein
MSIRGKLTKKFKKLIPNDNRIPFYPNKWGIAKILLFIYFSGNKKVDIKCIKNSAQEIGKEQQNNHNKQEGKK